jgi:hypothetical protein
VESDFITRGNTTTTPHKSDPHYLPSPTPAKSNFADFHARPIRHPALIAFPVSSLPRSRVHTRALFCIRTQPLHSHAHPSCLTVFVPPARHSSLAWLLSRAPPPPFITQPLLSHNSHSPPGHLPGLAPPRHQRTKATNSVASTIAWRSSRRISPLRRSTDRFNYLEPRLAPRERRPIPFPKWRPSDLPNSRRKHPPFSTTDEIRETQL